VWFVNLYNFMDGIDGITGVETVCVAGGVALTEGFSGSVGATILPLTLVAAALGFLRWNWHPARIFLGDVGSVPLGFLLGFLLLGLAAQGAWAPALILPLYYLVDATLTLGRRVLRGAPFWKAHREHFYQRALAPDGNHAAVTRLILIGNLILIPLAVAGIFHPWTALGLAFLTVAGMLLTLARRAAG
jgi:UDP-N-acetylmuramyl pentapeptide phosphotransferase/UDP-N-acetylglucosamine-1-phosphate transferase